LTGSGLFSGLFVAPNAILNVAINVPLSRQFDYLPPAQGPCPAPGCRVLVPFGRRRQVGLVLGLSNESLLDPAQLRRAETALDDAPLLADEALWLIRFTSDYYHHPIGEVTAAALPGLLRKGKALHPMLDFIAITDSGEHVDIDALSKRAPRQAELLECLNDAGGNGVDADTLNDIAPYWRRVVKPLLEKGLISRFEAHAEALETADPGPAEDGPSLNAEQSKAIAAVRASDGFSAFVLDGVTGSGKTEVYLHLIKDVLQRGQQTLVLVPEIGLTPQLLERFRKRLGVEPALLHSGLTDLQRLDAWRRARSGDAMLVVGTRSAIFTSLLRPGLIIVDEEHDQSFKQQEGLRYSARDLAIARAKHQGIPIVLGSATPTLEILQHCREELYTHLSLSKRAGSAKPPRLRLVDLNRAAPADGLSDVLANAIEQHLSVGGQVLLYLNRRGFAPTLICPGCGHVAECERCDSRMTVHARKKQLRCHHCGASRSLDALCSECGSDVRPLGAGTERLEQALRERFPLRTIMRIDSDSTQGKGAMVEALSAATLGKAEILVGTQMLSKGHHFPNLTLVGVVNADQGLFGTDFRSDERMAQSIVQVAGRAGREQRQGDVLIQTAFPQHPFWQSLIEGGYPGVSDSILVERATTHWPPFSRLALIRSTAHQRADAHAFLNRARQLILTIGNEHVRVLGPVDAVMARKAGRYRVQLLLQSADRRALHKVLAHVRPSLESEPSARKVRWSVDVDPIELF
jgi:primosomal protein N' (replication factor Y)